jgi:hypothetical protein
MRRGGLLWYLYVGERPVRQRSAKKLLFRMDGKGARRISHPAVVLTPIVAARTITVQIGVQPTRAGVIDDRLYTFSLLPTENLGRGLVGVRSFLGVDQGNLGEYAIDLSCADGRLYNRSMHKETSALYEAWERVVLPLRWPAPTAWNFSLHTLAHQTSPSTGNVQFELVLER